MLYHPKEAVFFDLDHTLWDFEKNARETLLELYFTFKFDALFGAAAAEHFITTYTKHNQRLWGLYNLGKIGKAELRTRRFGDTFEELGADREAFPVAFEAEYLRICPRKTHLFPHALDVLDYLKGKYSLHLISNGFREACTTKIQYSGLAKYFDHIVISEVVGVLKPDRAIFEYTLGQAAVAAQQAVMVGDNFDADVMGALNAGIEAVLFNPTGAEAPKGRHLAITTLADLKSFL